MHAPLIASPGQRAGEVGHVVLLLLGVVAVLVVGGLILGVMVRYAEQLGCIAAIIALGGIIALVVGWIYNNAHVMAGAGSG